MKLRIAHALTHAVAVILGRVQSVASAIENTLWHGVKGAQDKAYDYGAAAEHAIVNQAAQDLLAARRRLEQANTDAKAALATLPVRLEALRRKVFE